MYSRGNKLDFEKWSALLNDTAWNYENVLPYFKKSETFTRTNPYSPIDRNYHGYNGPLYLTQSIPSQEMSTNFLRAAEELGYNITDYKGRQQMGASIVQIYTKDGMKYDTEKAFIAPIKSRRNLIVLDRSYVTKIEIDKDTKKVERVIFTRDNKTFYATSKKEVILSAGVIASPQILMLSGIGPRNHLRSLGIPVIQNLPVGRNFRTHTYGYLIFSTNITSPSESLEDSVRDLLKGRGSLTRSNLYEFVAWFKTPVEQIENYPDMEILLSNISGSAMTKKYNRFSDEVFQFLNPNVSNPLTIQLTNLHQRSVGTVKLKNADPFEYPLIDPNLLSDRGNIDIETLYQGVQLALRFTQTEALRRFNITLVPDQLPQCSHAEPFSREYWYCYFRVITASSLHQVGTCASGPNSKIAVVDNKLKVFGIKGLRVADASVIPFPVSAHTYAACTMVGEKISDIIKEYYKK